jgi:hypothetical protein
MRGLPMAKRKPGRPKKAPGTETQKVEFAAEPDFLARLDRQCQRKALSRSAYVRMATMELIEKHEREERELSGCGGDTKD